MRNKEREKRPARNDRTGQSIRSAKSAIKQHFLLTTALAVPCLLGYGSRQAYAACANSGGTTYLCSGNETSNQSVNATNAAVTMDTGATVDTTGAAYPEMAITVSGHGNLSFTNLVGGTIVGGTRGLHITPGNGLAYGSATVNTNKDIQGGTYGIFAVNYGVGAITINAASVSAPGLAGFGAGQGIRAITTRTDSTGIGITTTGTVLGGSAGIYAKHAGTGTLTINSAAVSGGSFGIRAETTNVASTGMSITATGTVSSNSNSIYARHVGAGALSINAAAVNGGITGFAGAISTGLGITTTGAVNAGGYGINAAFEGVGTLTVNATSVTSTGSTAILASSTRGNGTGLSVTTTGLVTAQGGDGINAYHDGSGTVTINSVAVTSTGGAGISARSKNPSTGMSVTSSGVVTGQSDGINARHDGTGALAINTTSVSGTTGMGIYARNFNNASTGLTVLATGNVTGGSKGVYANHAGTGLLNVYVAGVTGTSNRGIDARTNNAASTGLHIAAGGAVSGTTGINTTHSGTGPLTINSTSVTGIAGRGINALTTNAGGSTMDITATGTVSSTQTGIYAYHNGAGKVTINATVVTGTTEDGIFSYSRSSGTEISVTGAVAGGRDGIRLYSPVGPNVVNIAASASVAGATNAINTNVGNTVNNDTVNNYGAVNGNTDLGHGTNIFNNKVGATIVGNLTTGTGNDTFANDGTFTGNANLGGGTNVVTNTSHNSFTGDLTTGTGNDTVTNTGTWTGNINLGGGTNAFNNNAGALFNPNVTVNLGAGNAFNNAGTFSPGGKGTIQTTALTGNFVQTAGGTFEVDLDVGSNTADKLSVSGTANVAGTVLPNLVTGSDGTGQVDIMTAAGGVTNNGVTVTDTVAADYTLLFNATTVTLGYVVDFTPGPDGLPNGGLNPNQKALGENLNAILAGGGGDMIAILNELQGITDPAAYQAALERLYSESHPSQGGQLLSNNHFFVQNLLSCPSTLEGAAVELADDKCLWARVDGRDVDIDRSSNTVGGSKTGWTFSGGYEAPIREDLRAGVSFSIESSDSTTNSGAFSEGRGFTIGAKVEKVFGALEASVGLYGGLTSYDTTRIVGLAGVGPAISDNDVGFGAVVGRVSHTYHVGEIRVVPMLDVAATYIHYGGVNETGAGAANLIIASNDDWVFSATPAIGAMTNVATTDNLKVNASVKAGVGLYSSSSVTFTSRFAGAPAGTPSFTTTTGVDDVVGNLSGAIEFQFASNASLRFGYEGRIGNTTQSHGGFARAVLPF